MTPYASLVSRFASRDAHARLADLAAIALGSLLMVAAARISIPFHPVPLSMQTFVAIGLGLALGPVRGGLAVLTYLAEGAAGLPVFAGSPAKGIGLAYMAGPTGGFLVGFFIQAVLAGLLARQPWARRAPGAAFAALLAGAAVYPTGLLWLGATIGFDKPVLALGLYPFLLGDVLKAALAAVLFRLLGRAA